jgi:hypothetical protein
MLKVTQKNRSAVESIRLGKLGRSNAAPVQGSVWLRNGLLGRVRL